MTMSRPSLSNLTPDPGPAFPPASFLDRCTELGLIAFQFANPQELTGESRVPPSVSTLIRSDGVARLIRARLMHAAEHGTRITEDELFPGCNLGIIAHRCGSRPAGYTVVVFFTPSACSHPAFLELCRGAGVDGVQLALDARSYVRESASDTHLAIRALLGTALDLEKIEDQNDALETFTEQLTDSYDTMDLLYSVGRSMREPFKPEQFLNFVCGRLFAARSFRWIAILFNPGREVAMGLRNHMVTAGHLPCDPEAFRAAALSLVSRGWGAASPQVLERVPNLSSAERPQVLLQPLTCKAQTVGLLIAGGKYGDDPDVSSYDIQIIEAAGGYINAFSENVALYEDQHTLFMGTVQALTAAIDAKDRYTFGHSERVAAVAAQLALASGMSREQAERVRIAGLVHDVGKIGVPEAVLTKQGRLTDEEFAHIKKHPEIGHTILRDISLLADVLPGVLHHHERYDGRGYPHGLIGEKIPFIARILAVADTFDAMSSTRSYRSAMPREVVLAEIGRCSGTQFDPALAMTFVKLDLSAYDALVARHASGNLSAAA
jgi:HD-GYP domain-containing protein (c-di-GMP phosphodiesterase class II)